MIIVWTNRHSNLQGSTNLSFTNFQHLASQQSKNRFLSASSLRAPEVGRHCIARHRKAITPPWSGSWLPVPTSMPWTLMVVASELEEWTRVNKHFFLSEFCFRTSTFPGFKHLFKLIEIAVGCGGKRKVKIVLAETTIELTLVFTWMHPS